ncbi:hypothetical protein BDN72DRAFT_865548 [Pluteus cervinus]|uniref:Uncharacterized protein n=1 Tax=Pluteus cervinus TaxID=181527 RepID=A0ACD3A0N7_9AGAR|nr:hypothetical protein BDN72DRAFT_865548 [Pluteus cervinus]
MTIQNQSTSVVEDIDSAARRHSVQTDHYHRQASREMFNNDVTHGQTTALSPNGSPLPDPRTVARASVPVVSTLERLVISTRRYDKGGHSNNMARDALGYGTILGCLHSLQMTRVPPPRCPREFAFPNFKHIPSVRDQMHRKLWCTRRHQLCVNVVRNTGTARFAQLEGTQNHYASMKSFIDAHTTHSPLSAMHMNNNIGTPSFWSVGTLGGGTKRKSTVQTSTTPLRPHYDCLLEVPTRPLQPMDVRDMGVYGRLGYRRLLDGRLGRAFARRFLGYGRLLDGRLGHVCLRDGPLECGLLPDGFLGCPFGMLPVVDFTHLPSAIQDGAGTLSEHPPLARGLEYQFAVRHCVTQPPPGGHINQRAQSGTFTISIVVVDGAIWLSSSRLATSLHIPTHPDIPTFVLHPKTLSGSLPYTRSATPPQWSGPGVVPSWSFDSPPLAPEYPMRTNLNPYRRYRQRQKVSSKTGAWQDTGTWNMGIGETDFWDMDDGDTGIGETDICDTDVH